MRHLRRLLTLATILAAIHPVNASAQTTGSIAGTVVDQSGQVIPGADVTAIDEATGQERRTVTNEVGAYLFASITPGTYTVRAELTGFKPYELKGNVVIALNRVVIQPIKLEVGQLAEVVTVTAVGEHVATSTTSHQAILDLKQVSTLAIRGRDPISLLKILPGVSMTSNTQNDQESFGGSFATAVPNIQGGRGQTIYVDGVNGGDGGGGGGGGGNFSGITNIDAIEEVNVQMSAYTAEYGLKGGAQVNFITKRGTSEYKGTAYTYWRNEALNATNYFNQIANIPKPLYRYTTAGGTLGGPVPKLAKINDDGRKLFFFYSFEELRALNPQQLRRWMMPTEAERRGDFSNTRTPSGALIPIRDPLTGQNFPGNIIPMDRADPRGLALLNLMPLPDRNESGYNFITQETSIRQPKRSQVLRTDYRPTANDSLSVKVQGWFTKSVGINVAGASARWGLVRQRYDFDSEQAKVDYTRILGRNTVFEANFGVFNSHEDGPPEDETALAGIQRRSYPALANLPQFAAINNPLGLIPKATWGTFQSVGNSGWVPNVTYDNRWPITGHDSAIMASLSLTHTRGAHTFKFGALRERENFGQARSSVFAGDFNFSNDTNNPNNAGFAFANAFLGQITTYTESMGRPPDDRRQTTYAWYAQDTWKVRSNVSVDLGLRMYWSDLPRHIIGESSVFSFERFDPRWGGNPPVLFRPITTAQGRRAENPLTGEILPSTYIGQMVPGTGYTCGVISPGNPCRINGVVSQGDRDFLTGGGEGFFENPGLQYDPRVGVAWAVNPRTVIRAAGGAFHQAHGGFYLTGGPAWRFDRLIRYTNFDSFLTGTSTTAPITVDGVQREDYKYPVAYRMTLGVQRELGWNTVLDLAYAGDRTNYIEQTWNMNQIRAGSQFDPANRDLTVAATAANPGALPDVFLRPVLGFGDINIRRPTGRAKYDSLQMQVTRRFTGGFEVHGSYTWSKGFQTGVTQNNPLPAGYKDRRSDLQEHVGIVGYIVEIPGGSRLFKGGSVSKALLDDWRASVISTFGAGRFQDVTATFTDSFNFSGGGENCGNLAVRGDVSLPRSQRTIDRWFNTAAFSRPSGRGDTGNVCSIPQIVLPGYNNHDLSLFKDFKMSGSRTLQFRWEIYNLFNTLQFQDVNSAAQFDAAGNQTNTNFGKVTAARPERRMQLSLRFLF